MRREIIINNIHIGEKIKEVLDAQERTVQWFADKLCCDRTNVYDIFKRSSLSTDQLERISVVLDFDFFALYNPESAHDEEYVMLLEFLTRNYEKKLQIFSKLFSENLDILKLKALEEFKESLATAFDNCEQDFLEDAKALKEAKHIDRERLNIVCDSFIALANMVKHSIELADIKLNELDSLANTKPCLEDDENDVEKDSTEV